MYQWIFFWLNQKFAPESDDFRRFDEGIKVVPRCCPAQACLASFAPVPCPVLIVAHALAPGNVIW